MIGGVHDAIGVDVCDLVSTSDRYRPVHWDRACGGDWTLGDPSLPLSPQERRIWDMLLSRPEDKPLTQAKIVAGLSVKGGAVSAENARKSLSGILRRKGVQNRR